MVSVQSGACLQLLVFALAGCLAATSTPLPVLRPTSQHCGTSSAFLSHFREKRGRVLQPTQEVQYSWGNSSTFTTAHVAHEKSLTHYLRLHIMMDSVLSNQSESRHCRTAGACGRNLMSYISRFIAVHNFSESRVRVPCNYQTSQLCDYECTPDDVVGGSTEVGKDRLTQLQTMVDWVRGVSLYL